MGRHQVVCSAEHVGGGDAEQVGRPGDALAGGDRVAQLHCGVGQCRRLGLEHAQQPIAVDLAGPPRPPRPARGCDSVRPRRPRRSPPAARRATAVPRPPPPRRARQLRPSAAGGCAPRAPSGGRRARRGPTPAPAGSTDRVPARSPLGRDHETEPEREVVVRQPVQASARLPRVVGDRHQPLHQPQLDQPVQRARDVGAHHVADLGVAGAPGGDGGRPPGESRRSAGGAPSCRPACGPTARPLTLPGRRTSAPERRAPRCGLRTPSHIVDTGCRRRRMSPTSDVGDVG